MKRWIVVGMMAGFCGGAVGQTVTRPKFEAFDVATVKPLKEAATGRTMRMEGVHRFVMHNFTLTRMIAAAYDLNTKTISGGPGWMDEEHFDVEAIAPGDVAPTRVEQMTMLRALLVERFGLKFHRVDKEFSIYELTVAKSGAKLKAAAEPDAPPEIVGVVYPGKIEVPAKSVSMDDFVAMLQRATLDRPTVNKTGLAGRFDFTLDWAPDETQYGGELPKSTEEATLPPLFTAVQEQLGLRLVATRGMVSAMVVDGAVRPVVN
jgi:uncharacterized protein (TIGR03435 family)